jgi:rRNA maturation endonuclease Nob1
MVILFKSFGNFTTGQTSYLALVSKKSRGTITLTDKEFSFKSEKDNILFQLRIHDIENFSIRNRLKLPTIELISVQGIVYTFYPHKKENSSLSTSKKSTEELFRQLARITYREESPILFETIGGFMDDGSIGKNSASETLKGIIFLNENYLFFKPFNEKTMYQIAILNILRIIKEDTNLGPSVKIQTNQNKIYSYIALKKQLGLYVKDKSKTEKLLEMIHQAKIYKTSEQIRLEKEDKERIERIKSMMEVSNRLRLDMMRIALDMDEKTFTEKVFQWAKRFKFLIDGDYLIVNQDTVEDFLNDLSAGAGVLLRRGLKISCQFCDKKIDSNAKICPYCGKESGLTTEEV